MKITLTNTKDTILSALKKYAALITPTYGPAGKKVLIATNEFSIKAADDGHAAANDFELENEFENAVVMYIREATGKTNTRVGDGTTTAGIITHAIVSGVMKADDPFAGSTYHAEAMEIEKATKEAVEYIRSKAVKIETADELYKIAYNSYNNEKIARLIADTLFKIGKDGVLSIQDSQTTETEVEIVEGMEIEKGYASPYLADDNKGEVTLSEPAFLLVNGSLDRFSDVVPVVKLLLANGNKNIVMIADSFGDDFLRNILISKLQGTFNPLLVNSPGFGDGKTEVLRNIAAVVGATIFDGKTAKLEEAMLADCGSARRVTSKKDKTIILGGDEKKIAERVEVLKSQLKEANQFVKDRLLKDIASLQGGVAVIKVGANTENELKSVKMKVEDSVNATKVAFKDGVVAGAGKTFAEIETSSPILNLALKAPRKQLEENGKQFLNEDVTDPAEVLVASLETASSIARGLIEMGPIIATKRKPEKDD